MSAGRIRYRDFGLNFPSIQWRGPPGRRVTRKGPPLSHPAQRLNRRPPSPRRIPIRHHKNRDPRLFRPLLERYPHLYVDTAHYLLDGGIEGLVERYGPGRLLFGSGFSTCYFGGMMLALKHSEIDEAAKSAIACENLERILEEVQL